tara:strand:+ start:554 stop:838 length:285 start_codon:yes stop_codon:yes gene_type:complete
MNIVNYVCIFTLGLMIDILFYNMIKSYRFPVFLSQSWNVISLGQIKELFLKSLKENPEILKKLETEESDEKTRALLKLILEEVQNDPEYSGLRH